MATAVGNTAKVVTRGLHIALDFSDNACFASGSGATTCKNLVNSPSTTSLNNQVSHKATNSGIFDFVPHNANNNGSGKGNEGFLRIPEATISTALAGKNRATVSFWINLDNIAQGFGDSNTVLLSWPIANSSPTPPYSCLALTLIFGTGAFRAEIGDGSNRNQQGTSGQSETVSAGTWTNIGWTWNGSTITTFKDGSLYGSSYSTSISSFGDPSADLYIGAYNADNFYCYDGQMGAFHLYDVSLSAAEILQNYNALKSRFGL